VRTQAVQKEKNMGIKIEAAAYSSIGGRKNNEDNFYLNGVFLKREQMDGGGKVSQVNTQSLQVYAVFDGMGGGDFGEYASSFAAGQLKEYHDNSEHVDHAENLRRFLTETSQGIDKISSDHGLRSGACGSTVAMLVVGDWWYRPVHVGDSRIYLLRDGDLKRVTKDQSEVQRLVDAGRITPDEAFNHPRKNVITHHLGMPLRTGELHSIIGERISLQAGDCFLICSDGVSDSLRDREILASIDPAAKAENIAATVVRSAKKRADEMGVESDNITAIILKVHQVAGSGDAEKRVKGLELRQKIAAAAAGLFTLGAIGALIMMLL